MILRIQPAWPEYPIRSLLSPFRGGTDRSEPGYTMVASAPEGQQTTQASSGHDRSFPFMAANRDPLAGKRLDSWKEIAAFFGRAERTVKRWEAERGLPVHRVPGTGRSSVFAYSDELADWLKGRSQELEADEATSESSSPASAAASASKPGLNAARVTAWLLPLGLAAALVAFFSLGGRGLHFKVSPTATPQIRKRKSFISKDATTGTGALRKI